MVYFSGVKSADMRVDECIRYKSLIRVLGLNLSLMHVRLFLVSILKDFSGFAESLTT